MEGAGGGHGALFEGHDVGGTYFDEPRTMKHNVRSEKQKKIAAYRSKDIQDHGGKSPSIKDLEMPEKVGKCFPDAGGWQTSVEKSSVSGE